MIDPLVLARADSLHDLAYALQRRGLVEHAERVFNEARDLVVFNEATHMVCDPFLKDVG